MPRGKRKVNPSLMAPEPQDAERVKAADKAKLVQKWVPQEYVIAARMTIGEDPPVPEYILVGEDNYLKVEDDGSNPQIVLKPDSTPQSFMHEYGHWLAFTFYPQLALKASRQTHERWAQVVEGLYLSQAYLDYPRRFCHAFFTAHDKDDD